ncbi:DUF3231 family protein [Lentibacillus jeotgali]|uniref:DUF3231 family protein n=1 Tax=Lentibacillus jeotgali TaxID=558169 RepID=UPI000A013AC2
MPRADHQVNKGFSTCRSLADRLFYGQSFSAKHTYAEDGTNIMIKHGWMEEPPWALDRDELANKKGRSWDNLLQNDYNTAANFPLNSQ